MISKTYVYRKGKVVLKVSPRSKLVNIFEPSFDPSCLDFIENYKKQIQISFLLSEEQLVGRCWELQEYRRFVERLQVLQEQLLAPLIGKCFPLSTPPPSSGTGPSVP